MNYEVKVPAICGEIVPLICVVDGMARTKATAFGHADFHRPAYDGAFRELGDWLVREAYAGRLDVCDDKGAV